MHTFWFEHKTSDDTVGVKAYSKDEAWDSLHEFAVTVWVDEGLDNVERTKGVFDLERITAPEKSGVIVSIVSGCVDVK